MPDHIHLIAEGKGLGKHISNFKSYSARKIIDSIENEKDFYVLNKFKQSKRKFKKDRTHQFWSEGYHPKQVFSSAVMRQKINYIHYNPVKSGLVIHPRNWKHSSFNDYENGCPGSINIKLFSG